MKHERSLNRLWMPAPCAWAVFPLCVMVGLLSSASLWTRTHQTRRTGGESCRERSQRLNTWQKKILLVKPDDWMFFSQPGAMKEIKNQSGGIEGYEKTAREKTIQNLQPDYYDKIILGKASSWVKVYVLNQYQALMDGKAVYQSFRKEAHVAQSPIEPIDWREIIVGIDFGRTPSAIFTQQLHSGKWTSSTRLSGRTWGQEGSRMSSKRKSLDTDGTSTTSSL